MKELDKLVFVHGQLQALLELVEFMIDSEPDGMSWKEKLVKPVLPEKLPVTTKHKTVSEYDKSPGFVDGSICRIYLWIGLAPIEFYYLAGRFYLYEDGKKTGEYWRKDKIKNVPVLEVWPTLKAYEQDLEK